MAQVLQPIKDTFSPEAYPDLLVGLSAADDAAVWRIDDERALVLTTDFFTPIVDDPYDFGAIAAANSLSDVYAMGGKPLLALNIACLPNDLPAEIPRQILRGGAEKAREAGAVIAGGHSVQDREPKYGLAVLGMLDPQRMLTKGGARVGDGLYLSKPLGFGALTTAFKRGLLAEEELGETVAWMKMLNAHAGELALRYELRCVTDITGFGLAGHGLEVCEASGFGFELDFKALPFVARSIELAEGNCFPGGAFKNRAFYGPRVHFDAGIPEALRTLIFDPQTSGGLLIAVPGDREREFAASARAEGLELWRIGRVCDGSGMYVR